MTEPLLAVAHEFDLPKDRVWLSASHQGPLPHRAAAAAMKAITWKKHPHHLATSDLFTSVPADLRTELAGLLAVPERQVTLANSASYGLHVVANGLGLGADDEVILAANDFPSDVLPWLRLRKDGVVVNQIRPAAPVPTVDEIAAAISPRTRAICLSWVHSFSGQMADLEAIGEVCHENNVVFIVNGSQGVGGIPIAPGELPIDALISVGFKWLCGPYGTGFLWMSDELADRVEPQKLYWLNALTSTDLSAEHLDLEALEPAEIGRHDIFGTANFINFAALTASVELIREVGVERIQRHNLALADAIVDRLDLRAYEVADRGDPVRLSSILFLRPLEESLESVAARLADHKVDTSVRRGMIRMAPHLYNTTEDVERLLTALAPER